MLRRRGLNRACGAHGRCIYCAPFRLGPLSQAIDFQRNRARLGPHGRQDHSSFAAPIRAAAHSCVLVRLATPRKPIEAAATNERTVMSVALIGRKAGMTRIFTDAGETVPVTVIEVLPNRITQVKSVDKDGYRAIQVSFGKKRPQLLSKAAAGHYAKANVEPGKSLVEFRLTEKEGTDLAVGGEIKASMFEAGVLVDVTGTTIGKGFAGTMKRHNFGGHHASHGVS